MGPASRIATNRSGSASAFLYVNGAPFQNGPAGRSSPASAASGIFGLNPSHDLDAPDNARMWISGTVEFEQPHVCAIAQIRGRVALSNQILVVDRRARPTSP